MPQSRYEEVYEAHARSLPPESAIGGGDFDEIGRLELSVLVKEGLQPTSWLFDFGCGTGRLEFTPSRTSREAATSGRTSRRR
jgi:hypothetical protein